MVDFDLTLILVRQDLIAGIVRLVGNFQYQKFNIDVYFSVGCQPYYSVSSLNG